MDLTHGGRTINDMEKFDNPNSDDDQVNEKIELKIKLWYSWFHIKGSWSVHSFNGDYLYIPSEPGGRPQHGLLLFYKLISY